VGGSRLAVARLTQASVPPHTLPPSQRRPIDLALRVLILGDVNPVAGRLLPAAISPAVCRKPWRPMAFAHVIPVAKKIVTYSPEY
jgi:hypothetical protein